MVGWQQEPSTGSLMKSTAACKQEKDNYLQKLLGQPIIITVKPITRPSWADPEGKYKTARRKITCATQNETENYSNMYMLHIDTITPEDHFCFNSKGSLSRNDYLYHWTYLSDEVEKFDTSPNTELNPAQPTQRSKLIWVGSNKHRA